MADEGQFQIVSRKTRRKRVNKKKSRTEKTLIQPSIDNSMEYCNVDRIISQIESFRDEIQASSFYSSLKGLFALDENGDLKDKIKKSSAQDLFHQEQEISLLSSHFDDIICYGVGCIQTCPTAKYQFALLLLLKTLLKIPNEHCCIYEPRFNKHDKNIVKGLGCSLIDENEEAKRAARGHTLFFMPHCSKLLYNNVLWANWGPALKNVVIFGNRFSSYQQRLTSRELNSKVMYIAKKEIHTTQGKDTLSKIFPYLQEKSIPNTFHLKDIFNDSSLHFFHEHVLAKVAKDFWTPCPEPTYDIHDLEIVTREKTEIN